MNPISFHRAGPNDIADLVEHRILFAIEFSGENNQQLIEELRVQMTDYFLKATRENTCISFIAKSGGTVAGIGSIHLREQPGNFRNPSGKWGYIMNMYTVPAFRRKGICTGILNALIEAGKEMGFTAFELHATQKGEFVYKQNGFEIHNEPTLRRYFH